MGANAAAQDLKKELKRLLVLVEERYSKKIELEGLHEEGRREEVYRLKDMRDILKKPPADEDLAGTVIVLARFVLNGRYEEFDPLYRSYKLAEK